MPQNQGLNCLTSSKWIFEIFSTFIFRVFFTSRRRLIVLHFAVCIYCLLLYNVQRPLLLFCQLWQMSGQLNPRIELSSGSSSSRRCYRAVGRCASQLSNESQFDSNWPLVGLHLWPRGLSHRRRLSRALFLWAAAFAAAAVGYGASRRERRLLGLPPYQRGQISQGNCHNFQLGNEKQNKIKSANAANDKTDCGIDKYKDVQREGETKRQKGRQWGGRADAETDRETDRQRQ